MFFKRFKELENKVRSGEIDSKQLEEMEKTGSSIDSILGSLKKGHKKTEFEETEEYLQELESNVKNEISEFNSKNVISRQTNNPGIK